VPQSTSNPASPDCPLTPRPKGRGTSGLLVGTNDRSETFAILGIGPVGDTRRLFIFEAASYRRRLTARRLRHSPSRLNSNNGSLDSRVLHRGKRTCNSWRASCNWLAQLGHDSRCHAPTVSRANQMILEQGNDHANKGNMSEWRAGV
jgi:hypothetical protein